jgi:hypothetical protein
MSKSNNNLCTPEKSGEQKGEYSPFFHTPSTEELKEILLNSQNGFSYSDEDAIRAISTFFHEETGKQFFDHAWKRAAERTALAEHIAKLTMDLATATFRLASMMSPPKEKETDPLSSCASRALCVSDLLSEINTNILSEIYKSYSFEKSKNIFFQIQKDLTVIEEVEKHLKISPRNIDERRRSILIYPPSTIAEHISKVLTNHQQVKCFSEKALIDSTKAAKQNNHERYNNILHNSSVRLHDAARITEAAAKELSPKIRGIS